MPNIEFSPSYGANVLTANTHSWADMLKAQSDRKKDEADLAASKATTALNEARLPGVEADSAIRGNQAKQSTLETGNAIIADAASKIDPSDPMAATKWDRAMKKAADSGAPDAEQWIGKYSPAVQARVGLAYSAKDAGGAMAAMQSNGLPAAANTADLTQQIAALPPEQQKAGLAKTSEIKQALLAVQNSPDPNKSWDVAVAAFGKPELKGRYGTDFQTMWQHVNDMEAGFRAVADRTEVGLPGAPDDTKIDSAGGNIYAIDPTGPGGRPSVTPLTHDYRLVGTDEGGKGVYSDSATGTEKTGTTKLEAKPGGAGGKASVFEKKRAAWLDTHPGDENGALAYANGNKGVLTPAEAMRSAAAQASRDLNALAMSGAQIEDQQQWLRDKTLEHYSELVSAQLPGGGDGGAPAAAAPDDFGSQRQQLAFNIQVIKNNLERVPEGNPKRAQVQAAMTKALTAAARLPAMKNPGIDLPARAVGKLREGAATSFNNGTGWTLRNGKPVRIW